MKFPLEEVLCIVIGYLITAIFGYLFSKITEKYNVGVRKFFSRCPSWTGIIIFVLLLLCAPFFCYGFTWGFVAYDYLKEGRVDLALIAFLVNVFGTFYTAIILKDFPKRR